MLLSDFHFQNHLCPGPMRMDAVGCEVHIPGVLMALPSVLDAGRQKQASKRMLTGVAFSQICTIQYTMFLEEHGGGWGWHHPTTAFERRKVFLSKSGTLCHGRKAVVLLVRLSPMSSKERKVP
jgi:hypothetical protein